MAWPTDNLDTTNLDAGTDSPALARPMLARLVGRVKSIIAARGVANGIASLDITGKIPPSQLPATIVPTTLWRPASGTYQQIGESSSALFNLNASAATFDVLEFGVDEYNESFSEITYTGEGRDSTMHTTTIPESPWAGYAATYRINRLLLPYSIAGRFPASLTSNTSITIESPDHYQARIYGIRGRNSLDW